jgi:carbonic anhydrase
MCTIFDHICGSQRVGAVERTTCLSSRLILCVPADPDAWSQQYPNCNSSYQSPIALSSNDSLANLPPLASNYSDLPTPGSLLNDGTTLVLTFPALTSAVSGGPFPNRSYVLDTIRFHWGTNSSHGSEHSLDGTFFPLEMQLIHRQSSFRTFEQAASSGEPNALAVIAVLFQLGPYPNGQLAALIDSLNQPTNNASVEGESASIAAFSLGKFVMLSPETMFHAYKCVFE